MNIMESETGNVGQDEEKIAAIRREIDRIDGELLELINQRVEHGLRIGEIKKANGWPVYVPERETEVLTQLKSRNPGPLGGGAVERIFQEIIAQTRSMEAQEDD